MEKGDMGDSGTTAFIVALFFSGKQHVAGLFREPYRKPFRAVLSAIFSLEKTGGNDLVHIGSTCNDNTLLELCMFPQVLHQPVKYRVGGRYQREP